MLPVGIFQLVEPHPQAFFTIFPVIIPHDSLNALTHNLPLFTLSSSSDTLPPACSAAAAA